MEFIGAIEPISFIAAIGAILFIGATGATAAILFWVAESA